MTRSKIFGILYEARKVRYFEEGTYDTSIIVRRYLTRVKKTSKYVSQHLRLCKVTADWEEYGTKFSIAGGLAIDPLSLNNDDLVMAISLDGFISRLMESENKMMVEIGEIIMGSTSKIMDEVSTKAETLSPEIFTIPGSKMEGHDLLKQWEKHNGYSFEG